MTKIDPEIEARVRQNFAEQRVMELIGAQMLMVDIGEVVIELPFRDDLVQQNGYIHAGMVTTILDSACGYAAFTMMPADSGVLSVEFKVNLLAPAAGDLIRAHAHVKRSGRTLTVCTADALAVLNNDETVCATMLATMFRTDLSRS